MSVSSSPSPSPSPSLSPSPLPAAPPDAPPGQDGGGLGFGGTFGLDGGATTALDDAEDESVLTRALSGAETLLAGFGDTLDASQQEQASISGNSYTNAYGPAGPLNPYTGQNVDIYTNTANTASNSWTVDTSQMLASNAPLTAGNPVSVTDPTNFGNAPNTSMSEIPIDLNTGSQIGPNSFSTGWFTPTPIDPAPSAAATAPGPQLADGPALLPSTSPAVNDLNSMTWEDFADKYNLAAALPVPAATSSSSSSWETAIGELFNGIADWVSPSTLAPPTPSASAQTSSTSPLDTIIGDALATLVGLFAPLQVGPYVHPSIPSNLPPGLQAMAQMNAGIAQQSLQVNSALTRGAVAVNGAPFAVTEMVMAAPAVGDLAYELSIRGAARFPVSTAIATGLGNALSGNVIPRAAVGTGAAASVRLAEEEALPALAPEISSSLPAPVPSFAQSPAAQKLAQNYIRGMGFQNAVTSFLGANTRNTTAMVGQTLSGRLQVVVPDVYAGGQAPIGDIKDVLRLDFRGQLQAMADLAKMTGTSFNLITSVRTMSVSGPLADAVQSSGGFIFRFDPTTNLAEVWDSTQNVFVQFF